MAYKGLLIFVICATAAANPPIEALYDDPAMEMMQQEFNEGDLDKFIECDANTWTKWLSSFPFFGGKSNLIPRGVEKAELTTIHQMVYWKSYSMWKTIDSKLMEPILKNFTDCMGYTPALRAIPSTFEGFIPQNITDHLFFNQQVNDIIKSQMDKSKRKRSKHMYLGKFHSHRAISKDDLESMPSLSHSKTPTKRRKSRWLPNQPYSLNDLRQNTNSPFGTRQISRSSRLDDSYRASSPKQDNEASIIRKMKVERHKIKSKMSEINESLAAQDAENEKLEQEINQIGDSFDQQIDDQTLNEILLQEKISKLQAKNSTSNLNLRKVLEFAEQIVNLATEPKVGLLSNKEEELDPWAEEIQTIFEDKIDAICISLRDPEYQEFIERLHEGKISSKLDLSREVNQFSFQTEVPMFTETAHFKKVFETDGVSISPEDSHPPFN